MPKKNGFIAISIIYSFFLCFVMLMMGMLANYTHSKLILKKTNEPLIFEQDNRLATKILENPIKRITPDFSIGFPTSSTTDEEKTNNSGLYETEDNDGTTYYFRGAVKNNYVKFGKDKEGKDLNWRIVRINGDGTIRLILDKSIGNIAFNEKHDEEKYVGYTYDNSSPCTKAGPCKSAEISTSVEENIGTTDHGGENSTIKKKLEAWYYDNLKEYDDYIDYGTYCNDTSYSGTYNGNKIYSGHYRNLVNSQPSMICPDPTANSSETESVINVGNTKYYSYGGVYKLKIGILSADEYMFGGIPKWGIGTTKDNYLVMETNDNATLTFTPDTFTLEESNNGLIPLDLTSFYVAGQWEDAIIPVINLKADIKITSGDGTKDNPFSSNN